MAETIRDVIIKLRIQQDAANLQVPDFSAIEQAAKESAAKVSQSFSASSAGASAGGGGGGESAGSIGGRASKSSKGAKEDVESLREAIRAAESQLDALNAAFGELSDAEKEAAQPMHDAIMQAIADRKSELAVVENAARVKEEAAAKFKQIAISEKVAAFERTKSAKEAALAIKEQAAAEREAESASRTAQAQINRLAGDLRSAGEGAFRAARGIALWTASSDEDLQKMIKSVSAVQGAWDIFSGGINVIRGVSSTLTAVSAAGGIYAVVATQVARAQAFVGATASAASVAVKALWGPVGIAVASLTAIVAVGTYAWSAYAAEADSVAKAAIPLVTQLDHLQESIGELAQAQISIEHRGDLASANEFLTLEQRIADVRLRQLETSQKIQSIDKGKTRDLIVTDNEDQSRKALELLRGVSNLEGLAIEQQKEKISLLKQQQQELQKNLDKQKSIADVAKQVADQERDRVRSLQAQVGRLDAVQQAELKRIGERVKAGKASEADFRRLEEGYGGLEPVKRTVEGFYRKKGAPVANDLLSNFNNGTPLTGQGSKLDELVRESDKEAAKLAETMKSVSGKLLQNQTQVTAAVNELLQKMNDRFASKSDIELMNRKFDESQRRNDIRNVGRAP